MAQLGPANMIYANGTHIFAHADRRMQRSGKAEPPGLLLLERVCPPGDCFDPGSSVSVTGEAAAVTILASVPLSQETWRPLPRGTIIALKSGRVLREDNIATSR